MPTISAGATARPCALLALALVLATPGLRAEILERPDSYQWRLCPPARLIPIRPGYTDAGTDDDSTEIRADTSRLVEDGTSEFTGDVEVVRGNNSIRADVVHYNDTLGLFTAEGRTHIWNGAMVWMGESATYDLNSEVSELEDGRYWLENGRGRGSAGYVVHDRVADTTRLERVDYSTCPLSDEAWRLSASRIKLDHTRDRGSATHAVLRVRDVPVFYFPYLSFPLSDKRKSGFLAPSIGTTNESGLDVTVPYYLNLAPNYDATISPRILSDRGGMLQSELRHMSAHSRSRFYAEYLPGDDRRGGDDRSVVQLEHRHRLFENRGILDVVFRNVSDDNYFEDFGSNIATTSQRTLNRQGRFRYRRERTSITALVQSYQVVDESLPARSTPYKQLPRINVYHSLAGFGRWRPRIDAETTYFDRDDSVTGGRVDLAPSLLYDYTRPWMYFRPKLTLRHTQYFLDDPNGEFDDNESRSLPMLSIDTSLFAERTFSLFGARHLQTFEPRVFYLLVPKVGQENLPRFDGGLLDVSFRNIFRENRFSGRDRVGDANQVTTAITSRILDTENGREAFRLSVGQVYYFRDREVTLPGGSVVDDSVSELIAEAAANLGDDWSFRGAVQWDPNEPQTEKSAVSLRYRPNLETVVNLSYRFRRAVTDVEQADVSLRWPLLDNLALVGRWNYSLPEQQTLEAVGGMEYESCCWGLRVVARRFLRNAQGEFDNGLFAQIHFRGLGGFGRKSGSLLRRGIPGYEDPFD